MMKSITLFLVVCLLALALALPAAAQDDAPPLVWTFETEGAIWSPPVVADGVVYFGSNDGHLYAVDAQSGAELWRFDTGAEVRCRPALTESTVIISSDNGLLYAVDRASGVATWEADIGVETAERLAEYGVLRTQFDYMQSSPAVADGVVYVGSLDRYLYAIDATTGTELWRVSVTDDNNYAGVRSSPAVANGIVYIGHNENDIVAFEAATGAELWRFDLGGRVTSSPIVTDGMVIIGSRGATVFALDALTGEEVWAFSYGTSWVESSATVVDGVVYIGSSDALRLYALDAATGAKLWEYNTLGWAWSTPAYGEGVVYIGKVGRAGAHFFAVNAADGTEIWQFKLEDSIDTYRHRGVGSSPAVADGVVYFGGLDGVLYAVDAAASL